MGLAALLTSQHGLETLCKVILGDWFNAAKGILEDPGVQLVESFERVAVG
jgi:hypothetical protein